MKPKVNNHIMCLYRRWMAEGLISHDNAMWALQLIHAGTQSTH